MKKYLAIMMAVFMTVSSCNVSGLTALAAEQADTERVEVSNPEAAVEETTGSAENEEPREDAGSEAADTETTLPEGKTEITAADDNSKEMNEAEGTDTEGSGTDNEEVSPAPESAAESTEEAAPAESVSEDAEEPVLAGDTQTEGYYQYIIDDDGNATITDCDQSISGDVVIPETLGGAPVTGIGSDAFWECSNLEKVVIPDKVTKIGEWSFAYCGKIKQIQLPEGLTSIGAGAFYDCTRLRSITIPYGIIRIEDSTFGSCYNLVNVDIPDSVTSIGNYAFADCRWGLLSIFIPDGVTSIGDYAFLDCYDLANINIPTKVTSIGDYAFSECNLLTNVYYAGSQEQWSEILVGNDNDCLKNASISYNSEMPDFCKVIFDANGGAFDEGESAEEKTIEHSYLKGTNTSSISSPTNESSHKVFDSWNTKADGSGDSYKYWETITVTSDMTLYAIWVNEYTVTFDANGGAFNEGSSSESKTRERTYADGATFSYATTPTNNTNRQIFDSWNTRADGRGESYKYWEDVTVTGDMTLYAMWTQGYSVTFDANGGAYFEGTETETSTWSTDDIYAKGSVASYYSKFETPTNVKNRKVLNGWNTAADGSGTGYGASERNFTVTGDMTIYAIWADAYKVTAHFTDGTCGGNKEVTECVKKGNKLSYSNFGGTYTPDDSAYLFRGWSLKENPGADDRIYESLSDIPVDRQNDVDIYAVWEKACIVTFDANGGAFDDGETTKSVSVLSSRNIESFWENPSKDGMRFWGWSTKKDAQEPDHSDSNSITVNSDTTYYAVWTNTVTLTLDANGGYFTEEGTPKALTKEVTPGVYSLYNLELGSPVRADENTTYAFAGWASDAAGKHMLSMEMDDFYWRYQPNDVGHALFEPISIQQNTTIYAVWDEVYTITFDAGKGTFSGGEKTRTALVQKGYEFNGYRNLYYPYVYGEDDAFSGWYLDSACTKPLSEMESYDSGGFTPQEDVTLYAKYEKPAKNIKITLDGNGGSYIPEYSWNKKSNSEDITVSAGAVFTSDWYACNFLKGIKACTGFSFDKEGKQPIAKDQTFSEDTTLYAQYDGDVTITFDGNGADFCNAKSTKLVVAEDTVLYWWGTVISESVADDGIGVIQNNIFTRDGYELLGFSTRKNDPDILKADNYLRPSHKSGESFTLYAQWAKKVTVTLNANGGHFIGYGGGSVQPTMTATVWQDYKFFDCYKIYEADLYYPVNGSKKIAGYKTADGKDFDLENDKVTGDMELYAQWTDGDIKARNITLGQERFILATGKTAKLYAIVTPYNADISETKYSSSDPAIASVDENGVITAKKSGDAVITISIKSAGETVSTEATVKVYSGESEPANTPTPKPTSTPTPKPTNTPKFKDVNDTKSFLYKSVTWASENNIVLGFSDGKFYPNDC